MKANIIIPLLLTLFSCYAHAEIKWSETNLYYLQGHKYLDPNTEENAKGVVVGIEHATGYHWGKSFAFTDKARHKDNTSLNEIYSELGIDVSLSWLTQRPLSSKMIKDYYVTTQWEYSDSGVNNYLYGLGLSLDIPKLSFFNANVYRRNNKSGEKNSQLSLSWAMPFQIKKVKLSFDGFIDYATNTSEQAYTIKTQPQLKFDIGHYLHKTLTTYIGIELDYWKNKYGFKGQNQINPQLMMQLYF